MAGQASIGYGRRSGRSCHAASMHSRRDSPAPVALVFTGERLLPVLRRAPAEIRRLPQPLLPALRFVRAPPAARAPAPRAAELSRAAAPPAPGFARPPARVPVRAVRFERVSIDIDNPEVGFDMDVHELTFPDESFDAVLALHVLDAVSDQPRALAELHRVLRGGGVAVLQVPIDHQPRLQRGLPRLASRRGLFPRQTWDRWRSLDMG